MTALPPRSASKCSVFPKRRLRAPALLAALGLAVGLNGLAGCSGKGRTQPPPVQSPTTPAALDTSNPVSANVNGVQFESVAAARGLKWRWPMQPRPMRNLEAFGCGCAFLDYDDDGWLDVLLVASPHPLLYRNKGDGTFEDVSATVGLDKLKGKWWTGVGIGDFNGDGTLDLALTGYRQFALMKNEGGKRFVDVTREAGLSPNDKDRWGSSAAFMDLDGSGRLDLFVLHYVIFNDHEPQYCEFRPGIKSGCPPSRYKPEFAELYENDGKGHFKNITASCGMQNTHGKALVVAFMDAKDDGKMDFYIGNDGTDAEFMGNLGQMKFFNFGGRNGTAVGQSGHAIAAMGADWADYDRDGQLDLAVSAFSDESYSLLRNVGEGMFEHTEDQAGISGPTLKPLGFGTKWMDFDNDGWPDLIFANGHVYDATQQVDPLSSFLQPMMLFHNEPGPGGRQFVDLIPKLGSAVAQPMLGRGSATGDIDNDGRMDYLVVDFEGAPVLLHNLSITKNHWITFDLRSSGPNRFAYGAKITARAGKEVWVAHVSPASSYLSSSDPRVHFGLGATTTLDTVTIRWLGGKEEVLKNVTGDRIVRVLQGKGIVPSSPGKSTTETTKTAMSRP